MKYAEKLKDPRWQKKRLEVLEARSWKCECCGTDTDTLHVHHNKYHFEPWDASLEDLNVLCESCHKSIHVWQVSAPDYIRIMSSPYTLPILNGIDIALNLKELPDLNKGQKRLLALTIISEFVGDIDGVD